MLKTAICGGAARGGNRCITTAEGLSACTATKLRLVTKTLLVMKLSVLFLTVGILSVQARGVSQNVTFSGQEVSLKSVFRSIEKQTGFLFLTPESVYNSSKPVSLNVRDLPLDQFLAELFKSQPLEYTIKGKSIFVSPKVLSPADAPPSYLNALDRAADTLIDINGKVVGEKGEPLNGVNVVVKSTKIGTTTDANGEFALKNVKTTAVLVVSSVGFEPRELRAKNRGSISVIYLKVAESKLDQVQVIAYGTATRRFSTSSMATVTGEEISKQPVTNPLLALQGQAPGLNVTATSGIPGSQVLVQVRGQNTLNMRAGAVSTKPYDQPLFIIDGVPFAAQNNNVNQFASLIAAQDNPGSLSQSVGFSPFNNIDPADIESISILKDADATSIYGTQGSNGVILITTKKGKAGPTSFDLNVNTSINSVSRPVELLNTQQYLQFRKDAFAADGITPGNNPSNYLSFAPDLTIYEQDKYTDWQDVIYGRNTSNTGIRASLSGGSATNTFLISAGYAKSTYNYPGDFADERFTLHSNLHHSSKDYRLSVDLTSDFGYEKNTSAGYGGAQHAIAPPNLPDLKDASGKLVWIYKGVNLTSSQFYSSLLKTTELNNYNFNTSLRVSYKLMEGLSISANLGYNRNNTLENSRDPGIAQNPAYINREANFSQNNFQTINVEPQINYNTNIGRGAFSILVGTTYKKNTNSSSYLTGQGYSNDNFLGSINGAPSVSAMDDYGIYRYSAGFARLNYIYDSKYIVNLTGRRDGSSNFGPGNQFGNFSSIGAGWIFSEETLFKKSTSFFTYGKIYGSYGTSGSDGIRAYQYQALYESFPNYLPSFQGIRPSTATNLYNPSYSWALKKSLNLAVDLGFFNNRLLLNATYYDNRESNQLVSYPLAIQAGFGSVLGNLDATVQNRGWEFSINSTNIKTKDFSWRTNFNISFNRNKLLSFPNLEGSSYATLYRIGEPTSIIYGYRYKGVNSTTGLFEFYTKDGAVTSNPAYGPVSAGGDQVPIANQETKYMGGIGNTLSWKRFNLYIFCQFSSRLAPSYLAEVYTRQPGLAYNVPVAVLNNYWQKEGDNAQMQRLASSYSSQAIGAALRFGQSSGIYTDATYLRVKTVSLSYQLPSAFLSKAHIKEAGVFVNAQNLLTFTDYEVSDPEVPGSYSAFPVQRVVAFGLNLKF